MYPLVEASGGQVWNYFRPSWPLVRCTCIEASSGQVWYYCKQSALWSDVPPGRVISWPSLVLFWSDVPPKYRPLMARFGTTYSRLIFGQMNPNPCPSPHTLVETSCGKVWYYFGQMYPQVQTSHGQVWYYFEQADLWSDEPPPPPLHQPLPLPPGRDILWPSLVLLWSDVSYPLVETSHSQVWY